MNKVSILAVNGGKDPEDGKWLSLFTNKLYEFTDQNKFNLIVWNNNVLDRNVKKLKDLYKFDLLEPLSNDQMFHPHAVPLQRLYNYTVKKHNPEIIILMDTDAFPIKKGWFKELTGAVKSGKYTLAGVWRDELKNGISPYIHASCMCFSSKFVKNNNLRLDYYEINTETKKHDTLSSFTDKAIEKGYKLYKLKRSNKNNFHRLMGGIYGDFIYHHGAGSRIDISFWGEKTDPEKKLLNKKINENSSSLLFNNFDHYISYLKGERSIDSLETITSVDSSSLENRAQKRNRVGILSKIKQKITNKAPSPHANVPHLDIDIYDYMKECPTENHLSSLEKPLGWEFSFPDIVGLGVPKAGTSWWFDNLLSHPHIVPHRFYDLNRETSKELHFFTHIAHHFINENQKNIYKKCFLKQDGVLCAEFSTIYFHNICALNNLLNTVDPNTKLVLVLRNPVDRYISHINHVMLNRTRRLGLIDSEKRDFFLKYSTIPEATYYSLYSDPLEYLLSKIGEKRLFVDTYENCFNDPENSYRNFIDFINIPQYSTQNYQAFDYKKQKNTQKYITSIPTEKEREIISDKFRADVARLRKIIPDLNLDNWNL